MKCRVLLAFSLCLCSIQARPKRDVIFFKNGDRMTCEIKKLDSGKLLVSAPYVDGTITIDWREVERIESPQQFTLTDLLGELYTGSLSAGNRQVEVRSPAGPAMMPMDQVMDVAQLEANWAQRFHGKIDAGLIYTKASDQSQLSVNASLNYIKPRWEAEATGQFNLTTTAGLNTTNRRNLQFQGTRSLGDRWFTSAYSNFLRSDEQSLDLRSTLGGGFGYWLRRTDRFRLSALGAVVFTREKYTSESSPQPITNNVEALLNLRLRYFRFKIADLSTEANFYPNLTTPGRVRLDTNTSFRFQLVKDLYWNFGIYSNFDSRPPANFRGSDYGVNTGLGYSF